MAHSSLEKVQIRLAGHQAQLLLAVLGLLSGRISGVIIICFRLVVETSLTRLLPGSSPENFEALSPTLRFVFPATGGLLVGVLLVFVSRHKLRLGVLHVMERLSYHEGHLPLRNAVAAFYVGALNGLTARTREIPIWQRTVLGGAAVGLCALMAPEIMGVGYDTVNDVLHGDLVLELLLLILFFKLFGTIISIGMGMPAGLIGPTLFIGATGGGAFGLWVSQWVQPISHPGLYAMLGMGAMMGAHPGGAVGGVGGAAGTDR